MVLEFNLVIPNGNYTVPSDFELILPVRFEDENGGSLNLSRWLHANNFFGRLIEFISVFRKDDQHRIAHPRPPGSVASYSRNIMQHMTTKQLEVIERDLLFVKDPVVGTDIYYRFGQEDVFAQYNHFERRRNKFARPIGDQFEFLPVVTVHRDNLIWRDNKYVIPIRLLNPFSQSLVKYLQI